MPKILRDGLKIFTALFAISVFFRKLQLYLNLIYQIEKTKCLQKFFALHQC